MVRALLPSIGIVAASFLLTASLLLAATAWAAERPTPPATAAEAVVRDVCDQRLVVLGELPSHGEAKTFATKATIVRELVERCGFDALFMEAGIYDLIGLERALPDDATPRLLDDAIGRFWSTRELEPWRRWLFERARAGTLTIGGLDDQPSITSRYARSVLPYLVERATGSAGSTCRDVVHRHLHWTYDASHPLDDAEQRRLDDCTSRAAKAAAPSAADRVLLENLASYVDRQRRRTEAPDRDEIMARNAAWHLARLEDRLEDTVEDTLEGGARIVVWTATVHASRGPNDRTPKTLGARLAERLGQGVAIIGFSAHRGQSSLAGSPPKTLEPTPADSLEALSTDPETPGPPKPWTYLDHDALKALGEVPSRLFGDVTVADWSSHFDGVVVFREETAPSFEPIDRTD